MNIFRRVFIVKGWRNKANTFFIKKKHKRSYKNNDNKSKYLDEKKIIVNSSLFSVNFYLDQYSDVRLAQVDPIIHYCKYGWKEGRNPSPAFNTKAYLSMYQDVANAEVNPLVHYIEHGKKEDRKIIIAVSEGSKSNNNIAHNKKKKFKFSKLLKTNKNVPITGSIHSINKGKVSFRLTFMEGRNIPLVRVNKLPTKDNYSRLEGLRKVNYLGCANIVESEVQSIASLDGNAIVELYSLSDNGVSLIEKKTFKCKSYIYEKYSDIERAFKIAQKPGAVGITVWEGAHNPIGRAKVLYDIVSLHRPAVIFAYIFGDFGHDLWEPLKCAGVEVVLIPYDDRYSYQKHFDERNIKFDTVWICKNRLHSFELASFISKPETACILDIDDNEDVFVASKASEFKPYGIFSKNRANYYLKRIPTRSVAGISIQSVYGGEIVRHARKSYTRSPESKKQYKTKNAVFIGTIRPHKNISELVKAISEFNCTSEIKIKLAIGGDFNPPSLQKTLKTTDTIILGKIANENLYDRLSEYDIVITGFPDKKNENSKINKFQISSKIGDGLAVGVPVLTPLSPSVEDLQNIPGLFIYTQNNFKDQLKAAIAYKEKVGLPEEFTLTHSFETFVSLEERAKQDSKAGNVFKLEPFFNYHSNKISRLERNLVLVWKQYDSGIYGRRIDHIARYYKQNYPDVKVTIVELILEDDLAEFMSGKAQFDNTNIIIQTVLSQKLYNYSSEGVEYRLVTYEDKNGWNSVKSNFNSFLSSKRIYPDNSVFILFPLHDAFQEIISIVQKYKIIIDLVDNQVKWLTKPDIRLKALKQYFDLISIADEVVSNSPTNIQYYRDLNFFEDVNPRIIPNWYTLPKEFLFKRQVNEEEINLIYSGNLNDRIDWDLLKNICKVLESYNGYLHIVGSSFRVPDLMKELLKSPNCVYHGVINEIQLLELLQRINFAVIPHLKDKFSKFMDPIKLKMYKKLGITSLSTNLPGLATDDPLLIASDSSEDFLNKLNEMLEDFSKYTTHSIDKNLDDKIGNKYAAVIDKLASK